ncbi:metallophosphoesterase [Peptococcaceae bacterium 1198_IL3148]
MRIGVLSDTHGNIELAKLALTQMGPIDCLLHAGDHFRDAKELGVLKKLPVYAVAGNCDWDILEPEDITINAVGKRIWLIHGHRHRVKAGHDTLLHEAKSHNIDVVIYGHTHVAVSEVVDNILIFNPGSLTQPRGPQGPTYGVIEIFNGEVIPYIFQL